MKTRIKTFLKITSFAILMSAFVMACDDDEDDATPGFTGETKTFNLNSVSNPDITGTVKFAERSDDATVVTISLNGTTSGNTHVSHIHKNSAAETGDIIIDLNAIDGGTGMSETVVTEMNDGTSVSYDELLMLNGYVNVHASATDLATLIAQGDIGENELTATATTYSLSEVNDSGIDGTVTFARRVSGSTLITVDLDGTSPTGNYPIYIHDNSIATTGPVSINLNNFNGATGTSMTSVKKLNNNTAITYDQLRDFNGHVNVETSAIDDALVAQGNIGSN